MAAAPLPCAGHTKEVLFTETVVVVVGCDVVVVGETVVVEVETVVVVVVAGMVVVVVVVVGVVDVVVVEVVGNVVVVVPGIVVVVVVVGEEVAHVGRTGDVAIAGVSLTGRSINNPLSPTARTAVRRIQGGGPYFTQ